MSHVSPDCLARATDHAVRRYAERVLGYNLGGEDVPDPVALARARAQRVNCRAVRRRLASVGGIVLVTGMRDGAVVVPLERMTVCVTGGAVVTLLTPPVRTPRRAGRAPSPEHDTGRRRRRRGRQAPGAPAAMVPGAPPDRPLPGDLAAALEQALAALDAEAARG